MNYMKLTSGGVLILGDRRSTEGLEVTDLGDFSTGMREFCNGEVESASDFDIPLLNLLTRSRGVAGVDLLGVSPREDLIHKFK